MQEGFSCVKCKLFRCLLDGVHTRVSRAEYEQQESRTVLDRLYAGSLRRFAAALHDGGSLTEEEVRELEEYLRTLRREE